MNHTAFFNLVKAGQLASCYLFEGVEEYIKQQALTMLCAKLLPEGLEALNLSELNDPVADELIAAAETLPFMGEKRVVVVRESSLLAVGKKTEDARKADGVIEYIQRIPPSACVIFYVKGKADVKKKLYSALMKQNTVVSFMQMNDQQCISWARQTMRKLGKKLDENTAERLVFTVGKDAALLRQEMEKLASFLGEREEVTAEDIDRICTRSTECTVFQMVDAQVAGKNEEAFTLLRDMLRSGEERIGILSMLLRQYRILYHMRCLLEEKTSPQALAGLLGISPYVISLTQQQARLFDKARLREAYDSLTQFDYDLKSGRTPQEGCVESAMLRLNHMLRA